jgi:hypothetical protein
MSAVKKKKDTRLVAGLIVSVLITLGTVGLLYWHYTLPHRPPCDERPHYGISADGTPTVAEGDLRCIAERRLPSYIAVMGTGLLIVAVSSGMGALILIKLRRETSK